MANFKATLAKKSSETVQIEGFRVFSGERMGERPEIPYAAVSWLPNYILITDFANFGGILTQWNISNVWFTYLMENAWQWWPEIWYADVSRLPSELLIFGHGLLIFLIFNPIARACEQGVE